MKLPHKGSLIASAFMYSRRFAYFEKVVPVFFRLSNSFVCGFLISGCLFSHLLTPLSAGDFIDWKQPHVTAVIENDKDPSTFFVQFKNLSSRFGIEINKISTECGCARLLADKERYEPSEEGLILGTLLVSDELTFNKKQILVEGEVLSDEVGVSFSEKIDLYILKSESIKLSNPTLRWELNSSNSSKATEVVSNTAQALSIRVLSEAIESDWDLSVDGGSEANGFTHSLAVAPKSTAAPRRAVLEMIVDSAGSDPEREYLTLIVE